MNMGGLGQRLCGQEGCRKLADHAGGCDPYPTEAWGFLGEKDRKKLGKAGFATPRGGKKGAYQNHVTRNGRVIIPFERLTDVDLTLYRDGYVIRLYPEQYFAAAGQPKPEFRPISSSVRVGENAFVLYRTHGAFEKLPPLAGWRVRTLTREGQVVQDRGRGVVDVGHYVLRLSTTDGERASRSEGPPQGVFAPEYADEETNYLCKCVLAWLIVHTQRSPYTSLQAEHLRLVLQQASLSDSAMYEHRGVLRHGLTCCPLCMKFIGYDELHGTIAFDEEAGLENAALQVEGATRSTIVNLFHLMPLVYDTLQHVPQFVAWGHAVCNTRLGQRRCYSLDELAEMDLKVGVIRPEGIETFGWISEDYLMIRSPMGAVWIQLNGDTLSEESSSSAQSTAGDGSPTSSA